MIDIGSIPMKNSISKLMLYMSLPGNKNCGGVAGEIEVYEPSKLEKEEE
jgi:hypothetical protein